MENKIQKNQKRKDSLSSHQKKVEQEGIFNGWKKASITNKYYHVKNFTLSVPIPENGQTHSNNSSAKAD